MKKIILIFMVAILFTSCVTKLKVTVKAADRELVVKAAEVYIKEDVQKGINTLENFYYNWNEDAILEPMYSYLEKVDNAILPPSSKMEYKRIFKSKFDDKLTSIMRLAKEAQNLYAADKNYEALSKIKFAGTIISDIQGILNNYKIELASGTTKTITLNSKSADQASSDIRGTIRTKFPILGDPMVSFLTKKENDSIWKSCYNKTVSNNFFGNADIAFILRGNPPEKEMKSGDYNNNFTIKGVRLDAKDSANALLTGLTQTLNFVANTQGIPLNIGQQQDPNTPIPVQNVLVTGLVDDKNTLENKKKKLTDYRKMLIEKINSENLQNQSGANLTAALLRIENFWNTLKVELIK